MKLALFAAASGALALAAPAQAGEVYAGIYDHAVDTPFTLDTQEGGADLQAGYQFDPILPIVGIQPYVVASVNTGKGGTDFVGAGVGRKFALGPIYVRPGVGLVLHDAPNSGQLRQRRSDRPRQPGAVRTGNCHRPGSRPTRQR